MKLAVLIGVSKYAGSGLCDLPGCDRDVNLVYTILSAQDDYNEVLNIDGNVGSSGVKQQLIEFIKKYKGSSVTELVFYYTGHGAFLDGEYYYLLSDYQNTRLHQTSLENMELDNLIRTLSPALTTKLVDSCQSGMPYIKDQGELQVYLKGTQGGFQNCYFMFSSHADESSYQDRILSDFTRALGKLVYSRTGVIRHKDIIDYVSDSFAQNLQQTPFFVVQADFTDQFCKVDTDLQNKMGELLLNNMPVTSSVPLAPMAAGSSTLKSLVVADAQFYCSKEDAMQAVERLPELLQHCEPPPNARDLFDLRIMPLPDYSTIPNIVSLGEWLAENSHGFFAEPTKKTIRIRKPKLEALMRRGFGVFGFPGAQDELKDEDYDYVIEERVTGVRPTTDMPFASLFIKATAKYPNVDSTACFLVPFVSRTHLLLFAGTVSYAARGWGEESSSGDVKWRSFQDRMKDGASLAKTIATILGDFWESTLKPIQKKFGLLDDKNSKLEGCGNGTGEQSVSPIPRDPETGLSDGEPIH